MIKWNKKNKNRIMKRLLSIELVLLLIVSQTGCTYLTGGSFKDSKVPEHVLVYAENQPQDYPATKAANYFAQLVEEQTEGRIQVVVQSGGQLGDEESVVTQMEFGGVDFSRVSLSTLADDIEALNVLMMPYLYSDEQTMWNVLDGEIGKKFTDAIDEKGKGIRALSWYDAGARNFYSVNEIAGIQDLKGMKIRVQESDVMSDMVRMLGADPIQMKYSEVLHGLQTGAIEGAENNFASYEYSNHYEAAKYCIADEHTRIPEVQLISEYAWNQLSEEECNIIEQCARQSAIYERELWQQEEAAAKDALKEKGVTIIELNEDEKEEFRKAVEPLYDKYCIEYMSIIEEIRGIQ